MPAGAPDVYRIPARTVLAHGGRYIVRFIDFLDLPLIYRGQYKQVSCIVDSTATISVLPAHLLQQGNFLRKPAPTPSTFELWY